MVEGPAQVLGKLEKVGALRRLVWGPVGTDPWVSGI